MKPSVLVAISQWVITESGVGESLKDVGTEVLQKYVWTPLKNKLINFFSSEQDANKFVEQLSTKEASNETDPKRDVEELYKQLRGEIPAEDLFDTVKHFFMENQNLVNQVNSDGDNRKGDNITYHQNANNIVNNKGVQYITFN